MAGSTVSVQIVGNASSLQRSLQQSERGLAAFGRKAQAFGTRMTAVGGTLTRGLTLPLLGIGYLAVRELGDSQRAMAQTEAVIESMGGAAGKSVEDVVGLVDELAAMSGIDDEGIQDIANAMLTFKNIAGDTFDEATGLALDLSVAFDRDLRGSAIIVGKALNDPIRGLSALSRVGVQFTDQQRDAIQAMVYFGDTAGAQAEIMAILTEQVGGSAEGFGETLLGRLGKLRQKLEDVSASILEDMMPALEDLAEILSDVADGYAGLTDTQQKWAAGVVAAMFVAGPATSLIGGLTKVVGALATAIGVVVGALGGMGIAIVLAAIAVAGGLIFIITHWRETEEFFRNSWNNIKGFAATVWGQIRTSVANAVSNMATAVWKKLGEIAQWFKELAGRILDALAALPGQLFNLGVNAIQSFLNGLTSIDIGGVVNGIVDQAGDMFDSLTPFDSSGIDKGSPVGPGPALTPADLELAFGRALARTPSPVYVVGT